MNSLVRIMFRVFERYFERKGYVIQWMPPILAQQRNARLECEFEFVASHLGHNHEEVFFVSIGANDGVLDDPLFPLLAHFNWRGLVVEPIPTTFRALQKNYSLYPKIELLNVAIAEQPGERDIFTISETSTNTPRASHYSSFDKELVVKNMQKYCGSDARLSSETVRCITIQDLVEHVRPSKIDILQIDAEGLDHFIVQSIDFSTMNPWMINFEHASMSKGEQDQCARLLVGKGYRLRRLGRDTLAYRFEI